MLKKDMIAAIIANGSFTEADKPALEAMTDATLAKLAANDSDDTGPDVSDFTLDDWLDNAPAHLSEGIAGMRAAVAAPTKNEAKTLTTNEWLAQCPPELADQINAGTLLHNAEREKLVTTITANANNVYTKEQLAAKPFGELQAIARLAATPAPVATVNVGNPVYPVYAGANPVPLNNSAPVAEKPIPKASWDSKK